MTHKDNQQLINGKVMQDLAAGRLPGQPQSRPYYPPARGDYNFHNNFYLCFGSDCSILMQ